jgi:CubicO group peptidase (beta-lactamase class C family)
MFRHLYPLSIVFAFLTALLCGANISAKEETSHLPSLGEIDAFILSGMKQLKIPGSAFARIEDGEVTHIRGYGNAGTKEVPITPKTVFQIASLTKSFTSLVILQMEQEGKLSIDDPVIRYIPYFRTQDAKLSANITIRHLMNHRSGLSTLDGNRYQRSQYRGSDATQRAVRKLRTAQLRSQPGTDFHYSNANYATLAHIIETIDKMPFESILQKRIFGKIGMDNSYVQIAGSTDIKEAKGHIQWFGFPVEYHFLASRMMVASGGITASAEDLAKYLIAVSDKDPRIVPPALTASWQKDHLRAYEFGWEHDTVNGQHIIFHDGANPGFRSLMMYNRTTRKGALFLMNMSGTLEGNLHYGSVRYALGLPGTDISPQPIFESMLWGSMALLIILIIAGFLSLMRLRKMMSKPWDSAIWVKGIILAIPSLCLISYAFALWYYVPRSFGVDFSAASLFYPDLGLLLILQIAVALIWAFLRSIFLIKRVRLHLDTIPASAG